MDIRTVFDIDFSNSNNNKSNNNTDFGINCFGDYLNRFRD